MTKNEALPPLTGTDKQIAWAEKIRSGLDAELDARLAHFAPEIADRYRAVLIGAARRLTAASWWIDSRDFVFKLLLQERTDDERALCKEIEQASRDLRAEKAATPEPVTMKTSEVRKDMRRIIAHVEDGGTVIVEHYNRPVATIAPYKQESTVSDRDLSDTELIKMHLSYGPGGHEYIDAEVWRRWPDLRGQWARYQAMVREDYDRYIADGGSVDVLDESPLPPEMAAAREEYLRAVKQHTPEA